MSEPTDDDEQRTRAEQRRRARRQVKVSVAVAAGLQLLAVGVVLFERRAHRFPTASTDVFYNTFGYGNGLYVAAFLGGLSVLAAIFSGAVTLARWPHVSKGWIALGLLPWGVLSVEAMLFIVFALPWGMSGRGG